MSENVSLNSLHLPSSTQLKINEIRYISNKVLEGLQKNIVEMYPVIVLLGGFGSRLKPISNGIPKALMKVGKGVFLDILLKK